MNTSTDVEYTNLMTSNPNMESPYARLLVAILINAIHDAVSAQSSALQKAQAWHWLNTDDTVIEFCLSVVHLDRSSLLRRVKYMKDNNINLKNMYTKKESL